ncbi:MAG: phage recombination protein Bet [Clostridium sp.]|nr:phage recombination protein Bet [Clostridium sp.]
MADNQVQVMDKEMIFSIGEKEIRLTPAIVNSQIARGGKPLTIHECAVFMQLCKYQELNPFTGEAYAVKFGNEAAQLIVSKAGFLRKAEEHPKYKGHKAGIIVQRGNEILELEGSFKLPGDNLVGGWAEVYVADKEIPIREKVSLEEYRKNQATWKSMPSTMIRKVALVHALREAFPTVLNGCYVEDELKNVRGQANTEYTEKSIFEKETKKDIKPEEPTVEDSFVDSEFEEV